jgi:DNA-binding transcriptional ArsR family regulator
MFEDCQTTGPAAVEAGGGEVAVAELTSVLSALSDPMRLAIVRLLAATDASGRSCGSFDLPVSKSTLTHHFRVLREAGIIEHRCLGTRRLTTLRRAQLDERYPGLLDCVLRG